MRKLLFTLALLLGAAAFAQATISPQGIIVNPKPGDLRVKVWVNKDPHRTGNSVYQIGEKIKISVTVNRSAYVYLFNVNADGTVDLILPNAYDRNNYLKAGEVRTFPPKGARYEYTITGPEGANYVLALASLRPLSMGDLTDIRAGRANVKGLGNLSRQLSIVVKPVPNKDWASDALRYYVGRRTPPPPVTGTLDVSSSPSGAKVYINGSYRGRTPLTLGLNPGSYDVEIRLDGYQTYRARVRVQAGKTSRLSPRLARVVTTGNLSVNSLPQGAEVYVDGSYRGRTPLNVSLNEGTYDVELRLPGYETYVARVRVRSGKTSRLAPRLQPVVTTGTLEIYSTPSGAEAYVDGVFSGYTPVTVNLDAGSHEVEVKMGGYGAYRTRVSVQPGSSVRVNARLAPAKATLDLYLNTNAEVFLDGYPLGTTKDGHLTVKVDPGDRELVLIATGYHAYVKTIHLAPGSYSRISVQLSRIR
ncbi:PEGA domain-containing protein [Oceanithermus sp.]